MKKFNTGLIVVEPRLEDYMLGSFIPYQVILPDGNWSKYFPRGERQKFRRIETMACVSYATNDSVETQINRMIKEGIIETELIKDWIDENGDFNLSDRFLAKMSGTTENGNSLNNPPETLRKFGCCPEKMWPGSDEFSWYDYYRTPSKEAIDKSKKLLDYFDFNYEWCSKDFIWGKGIKGFQVVQTELLEQLKQCPLIVGTATCPGWFPGTGVIPACTMAPNHGSIFGDGIENKEWVDLDHYEPYVKHLSWWYRVPFAIKMVVQAKNIILKNKIDMAKAQILKEKSSPLVGLWIPAKSPKDLQEICKKNGINIEVPVDWGNVVKGTVEVVNK